MFITKASKSAFETFEGCSWQYYLQYILKIKTPSNRSAVLGTICHKVLEILARQKKRERHKCNYNRNDPEYLLTIVFNNESKKNKELSLNDTDKQQCRKWLNNILNTERDPRRLKILDIEHGFCLEFHKPGFHYEYKLNNEIISGQFMLNGYIDLVNEIIEDGVPILEIVDYKFGKYSTDWATGKEKTDDNIRKDLQLRCYHLAARYLYSQYKKIKLTVVYVQLNKTLSCYMDEFDSILAIDDIRRRFKNIYNTNIPVRLIDDSTRKQQHFKCRSVCYFGKTKLDSGRSMCEQYYLDFQKNKDFLTQITIDSKKYSERKSVNDIIKIR